MRHWLFSGFLTVALWIGAVASAQFHPFDPFEVDRLTQAERRYVQAALAFEGHYDGRLDGVWGRGSQGALDSYARAGGSGSEARVSDLRRLLLRFGREVTASGWIAVPSRGEALSQVIPAALLTSDGTGPATVLSNADNTLVLRGFDSPRPEAEAIHARLVRNHVSNTAPFTVRRDRAWVTAIETFDGTRAYLRTDFLGGAPFSRYAQYTQDQEGRARLVIASLTRGPQDGLALPRDGYLDALINDWGTRNRRPADQPGRGDTRGTGFYVNNTDLVTAAAALQGCPQLRLASGEAVTVLAVDKERGLAALQADRRSAHWLVFNTANEGPRSAVAAGFGRNPRQGMTLRDAALANAPALLLLGDRLAVVGSFGPGFRGAPLLDRQGRVVGALLGAEPDGFRVGRVSINVSNVAFAAPAQEVLAFLNTARIAHQTTAHPGLRASGRSSDALAARTVALVCDG